MFVLSVSSEDRVSESDLSVYRVPGLVKIGAASWHGDWLGYGDADRGPAYNSTAGAAAQLLLPAAALRLP